MCFIKRESGIEMVYLSTLKPLSNIFVLRQMVNAMYKEILNVCEAIPCAKPLPLTLNTVFCKVSLLESEITLHIRV